MWNRSGKNLRVIFWDSCFNISLSTSMFHSFCYIKRCSWFLILCCSLMSSWMLSSSITLFQWHFNQWHLILRTKDTWESFIFHLAHTSKCLKKYFWSANDLYFHPGPANLVCLVKFFLALGIPWIHEVRWQQMWAEWIWCFGCQFLAID